MFKIHKHIDKAIHIKLQDHSIVTTFNTKTYISKYIVLTYGTTINYIKLPYGDPQVRSYILHDIEEASLRDKHTIVVIGSGDRCAQICRYILALYMHANIHIIVRAGTMYAHRMRLYSIKTYKYINLHKLYIYT